ncbi:MAG: hypothetical protein QNJ97_17580 [Myxococcota bacterium]|nr:hypothetical protein [Myxococcota bacterium]
MRCHPPLAQPIVCGSIALALIACAPAPPPPTILSLKKLIASPDQAAAKQASPVAWEEGTRYLSLAEKAAAQGDTDKADRLANLGIIQTKAALAGVARVSAQDRLDAVLKEQARLNRELEQTRSAVRQLEAMKERLRIREHLVRTVDETYRRAAAAETLREAALTKEHRELLNDARLTMGREMMARANIWQKILSIYAAAGAIEAHRIVLTSGSLALGKAALDQRDLAALQGHIETAGIETRRLMNEIWEGRDKDRTAMLATLREALVSANFDVVDEEFGMGIVLPLGRGKTEPKPTDIARLADIIMPHQNHVLVVATVRGTFRPPKAMNKSTSLASRIAQALERAGVPGKRVFFTGSGLSAPLTSFEKSAVCVIVVPMPNPDPAPNSTN